MKCFRCTYRTQDGSLFFKHLMRLHAVNEDDAKFETGFELVAREVMFRRSTLLPPPLLDEEQQMIDYYRQVRAEKVEKVAV